jgi:hypothetical protein
MENSKAVAHITLILYVAAILVCIGAVYSLNIIYNQPQPLVQMTYNSVAQAGEGYINDTFSFPIAITSIYCTLPSGKRMVFSNPSNNIVEPNSNTYIVVGISSSSDPLSKNCTDWKVSYTNAQGIPVNNSNGIQITQS